MSILKRAAHAAIPILHRAGQFPACSRKLNAVRRALLPRLDGYARRRWNRPLVREKDGLGDEYVTTVDGDLCELEQAMADAGFERAVVSTLKVMTMAGVRNTEAATWAYHDSTGYQTHVYVVPTGDRLAVYAHCEPSYLADPAGHEGGTDQEPGACGTRLAAAIDGL